MKGKRKRMNVSVGTPTVVNVASSTTDDAFQIIFDLFEDDSFDNIEKESIDVSVNNGNKLIVMVLGRRIVNKERDLTIPIGTDLRSISARYVRNTGRLVVMGTMIKNFDIVVE